MNFGAYEVEVASITAAAVIIAALVPTAFAVMNARRIGKPNGRGSVVEMVGQALTEAETAKALAAQAVKVAEASKAETHERLDAQDRTLERIETAMRAAIIDRGHAQPPEHG
jgi:hypothetical protein